MKIGLVPINVGVQSAEQMIGLAKLAESLGFESVWTFEHVVVPIDYESKYPYDASGKMGAAPETNFVDPLIAIGILAAHTETLRFGTGVNILSQANPLYLAKQAASLDFVSGGRFSLGVGIGWLREEFRAMGVPFERRGARFDDYLQGMRKVWSGDVVDHQSEFLDWSGFKSYPLPANLPVVIGGNKGKVFDRIARYGDGWFAPSADPEDMAESLGALRRACEAVDRSPDEIEITCLWPAQGGADAVARYAAAGVGRLLIPLPALGEDSVAGMQAVAADVLGA
jgi:probable F420-dependent oxidoreductase